MKLVAIILVLMLQQISFKESQLIHNRVKTAFMEKEVIVKGYFENGNLDYNGFYLFIRAFKKEKMLEVWVKEKSRETYWLLQTYPFCTSSGQPGPKRKEGDLQIPEGVYQISHFNPKSNFHLSLGLNYPNASDRILSDKGKPGGSIYIHGNCVTIGCIPITDDKIKELYVLAVEARNNGQSIIPVHIFPTRLNDEGLVQLTAENPNPILHQFWKNLQPIFLDFEKTKKLKAVKVGKKGEYFLN